MKTVLSIGAVVCCAIGLFLLYFIAQNIIRSWPEPFHDQGELFATFIVGVIVFLAFVPVIMLFQNRRIEMTRFRSVLIGVTEFAVFLAFLAMLLPAL
jgi:hypothetical protein